MIDTATDGERLCNLLDHRLLVSPVWGMLASALESTGRHSEFADFYRQVAAVALTGRIVSAGVSLAKTMEISDPGFKKEFVTLLRDYVGIPSRLLDEVFRFSQRAVLAALEPLPKSLQKRMQTWALHHHSHCYMCGVTLTFENQQPSHHSYTCEHVWPSAYGGNSIIENLLPACSACNSSKKANFATWVMPAIQSLILGLAPPETDFKRFMGATNSRFIIELRKIWPLANT